MPLPRNFLKILYKNSASSCKIFAYFTMHLVNSGTSLVPSPLNPPLAATAADGEEKMRLN